MEANHAHTNQSGSVVSFVVIGVVLIALVAGGVYLLQHRDDKQAKVQSPSPVAVTSSAPVPSSAPTSSPKTSTTPAPSKSTQPSASPKPSVSPQAPIVKAPVVPGANGLPATGPSDSIPGGFAAAILLGTTVAFVQSQRARRHLFGR
jgi:cytoskeletal protein RodZ